MRKRTVILIGFIVLKFVLQYLLISPEYDLQRDEYLHLDQGRHLAWGYISVSPLTSWISWVIVKMGNPVWLVRFFPALFGALTILVVWKSIEALKGNLFALVLGATGVLFSVLLRLNILYQPNSFDVLAWTLLYYCLLKYMQEERSRWIFYGAIAFAAGFLNKYNIVFLLAGMAPALLLTPQRRLFVKRDFYLAILLVLLLILPNLLWQYQNDFPVVYHMKLLAESQLVHVSRWNFIKSQLLFFAGAALIIAAGLIALLFYPPFRVFRAFGWSFLATLAVFLLLKSKDYYAIGVYPIYIAFGAAYLSNILVDAWKRYLQPVAIIIPVVLFLPMYQIAFPNRTPEYILQHQEKYRKLGMLRWEDGQEHPLPQDFADMLGWKELAQKVDAVYVSIPEKKETLVLCDNYGQAGAINYYTKAGIRAVTFNADYINWIDTVTTYRNLIRVKTYTSSGNEMAETGPFFQYAKLYDSISNPSAREYRTAIFSFSGARTDINKRINEEIAEVKAQQH